MRTTALALSLALLAVSPAPRAAEAGASPADTTAAPSAREQIAQQLGDLLRQRAQLLSRVTPLHPEVRILNRQIESLEAEQKRLTQ